MTLRNLRFEVHTHQRAGIVRLWVDDTRPVEDTFDEAVLSGARIDRVLRDIAEGRCRPDDLRDVGTHLWDALLHGDVEDAFERARAAAEADGAPLAIRILLPPHLEPYPWEALYDERRRTFLAIDPGCILLRDGAGTGAPRPHARPSTPLTVLVVIPERSGLHVDHEWNNMRLAVGQLGDAIRLERIDGRVTAARLYERLRSSAWDVLHYIGHGEEGNEGTARIRLNADGGADDEYWMDAEPFSTLFAARPPRLAVLNCCLGAMPDRRRTLGGLGPLMMRRGVPATVAMRYEIQDDVAIKFADAFYRELLTGDHPGRVDLAVRHARHAIYLTQTETNARGFITPILHLAPGYEALFDVPGRAPRVPAAAPAVTSGTARHVPEELQHAIHNHDCVLVLGAIGDSPVRSAPTGEAPAPGPRELALRLAVESQYPLQADLDLAGQAESWLAGSVLQAVCQYYQRVHRRHRLIQTIQQIYQGCTPSEPQRAIARWDAPGIIYTHFDGMMEEAFRVVRRTVRLMTALERSVDTSGTEGLLVHLRGTVKDARSLVLTEEDHDLLLETMTHLPSHVVELARGTPGRSVLFMGVSPRDPLVRRLSRHLIETGSNRLQGPTFFVSTDHTAVDDAYWSKYDVTWIPLTCEAFVHAVEKEAPV